MPTPYNPAEVEPKWQAAWSAKNVYRVNLKKAADPFYGLVMFPYPSGDKLHVGHWYNFAPADSAFRYQRMLGKDVFEPMGFDAFGLPAENYAIKTGIHPDASTRKNVETMVQQLTRMGCMYDWEKALNTSTPEYYRWTQWLFLQMLSHGLAYKREASVNYCPNCQTVLANEQVTTEGTCERCGTQVVQKQLNQWFWKITDYADRLLNGLEHLEWPEKTKSMQRNWIGRKEGINITYKVEGTSQEIVCFTTRPDTNFGATFLVLAPEHPFIEKVINQELTPPEESHAEQVRAYRDATLAKTELERQEEGRKKTGTFTGYYAVNQLTGRRMPIWTSDFVLAGFGTGAVVGVPGHDKRDFEFAKEFAIDVIRVVVAPDGDTSPIERIEQVQEDEGVMVNSGFLDGLSIMEAKEKIMEHMEKKEWGKRVVNYRLRDWLVSRQRYWGAPIPVVYDPEGNPHPVPEKHLPWLLPTDVEFRPTGKSPLAYSKEFIERTEKIFGKGWRPEFDTMDTFVCSSFYQLRYLMQGSKKTFVDPAMEQKWMPVSLYIGGPEHATMHLIYARFVMMALKDFGFVSHEEPFKRLVHQGLITNKGAKMSKSRGNVVSPDDFVARHGADVFRMYLMFMGPFEDGGDWSDHGIKGIDRFIQRAWTMFTEHAPKRHRDGAKLQALLHRTIKRVTDSIMNFRFNTAVSALMEFLNAAETVGTVSPETARTFAKLIAPLAPHFAEEVWSILGGKGFVVNQSWPTYDPAKLVTDTMTVVVQVNGKLRGDISVAADASEAEILRLAKEHENVQKFLTGSPKKEIYVKGKLVNLVV